MYKRQLLGVYLAQQMQTYDAAKLADILEGLQQLPELAKQMLTDDYLAKIQDDVVGFKDVNDIFFIGRGLDLSLIHIWKNVAILTAVPGVLRFLSRSTARRTIGSRSGILPLYRIIRKKTATIILG